MINPPTRPLSVEEILRIVDWQFLQSKMSPTPLADQVLSNSPTIETAPDPSDSINKENLILVAAQKKSYKKWIIVGAVVLVMGLTAWGVYAYRKHQEKKKRANNFTRK